jgi:4-diphosphocytidyl-2-C-methyl-D-erythritol kinase
VSEIRLLAPAKVNLSLEVVGKRDDGYHEVRTVLQAVDLADVIELARADDVTLTVEPAGAVAVEGNLALRAARLLREASGERRGAKITLHKRIPVAAGLGGGSSDAAATLLGLRRLWSLSVSEPHLDMLATAMGSDVSFFLHGGTALGTGRGDQLEGLPMPAERYAVIVSPSERARASKTARLYGMLRPEHYGDGSATTEVVRRIVAGEALGDAPLNTFARVAFSAYDSYELACTVFGTTEAAHPLLAGAGPSLFTLVDDDAAAERISARMRGEGYETHVARLLGAWGLDGLDAG